ncbi:DUF481 domain-containing protein [Lysobacter sp. N42]|nr:DUF481 domain-containing protein [Aliidiomarina sp. B3213]TCZ89640.1 DUF481 domain-containing protein [Lysobacter sp. N42]
MFDDIQDRDPAVEEDSWSASAEFGFLMRSGNTETESWKAKFDLSRDAGMWRHKSMLDYYRQERETDAGDTAIDADRLFMSIQSNRLFRGSEHSSLFIYGSYEDDALNSFDYQSTIAAGYGARYRFTEKLYADFEVGPGMSYNKYELTGETESEGILRMATNVNWTISENSKFTQLISTEIGEDNTRSRAVSSLTSNLNSKLAMRLSLTLTHNSQVTMQGDGTFPEKLDTETAVTLVYTFQ